MQQSNKQNHKQSELLSIQNSTEENLNSNSSNAIISREKIEDSPFELVTSERGTFIAMGNRRMTEPMEINEARTIIGSLNWNFLLNVIIGTIKTMQLIEKEQNLPDYHTKAWQTPIK